MAPPFRYEAYQPQNLAGLASLIGGGERSQAQALREAAAIRARQIEARGQSTAATLGMVGSTLQTLGQLPQQLQQQRIDREQEALKTRALTAQVDSAETANSAQKQELAQAEALKQWDGNPNSLRKIVGPQKAMEILKAQDALKDDAIKRFGSLQTVKAAALTGILAFPTSELQAAEYQDARGKLLTLGVDPSELPETYDPAIVNGARIAAMTPDKAEDVLHPKLVPVSPGTTMLNPQTNQPVFTAPEKKPDVNAGSLEDYVSRLYGPNPTAAQILDARQKYADAGSTREPDVALSLTPEALKLTAHQYAMTGQLPPMGMGKQGASVRTQIINEAAKIYDGLDLPSQVAAYKANQASLTKMQPQLDAITAFENTAGKNLEQFLDQAKKVTDTGSPFLNRPIRTLQGSILGDPKMAAFNTARTVVLPEFARIISNPNLTGVLSDSARREVEALIKGDATLPQIMSAAKILTQDAQNRRTSLQQEIDGIKQRIATPPGSTPTASPAALPTPPAALPPGVTVGAPRPRRPL